MARATHPVLGKTVLITGAARGIGAETARRLAGRGAKLVLVGLEPDELEATARLCSADALAIEADVTDLAAMEAAIEQAVERFGGLDVLVANAGVASFGTLRTTDPEAFERTIEVNLLGQFRTIRAALDQLVERRGYLLTVASAAAIGQAPGMGAYAASKAGVEAMCNSLRLEVGHLGVEVGVAYLSWIDTDMVGGAKELPAFQTLLGSLPAPTRATTPLPAAGAAMADGVERRARVVALPGWVRAARYLRGFLATGPGERGLRAGAPEVVRVAEAEVEERGAPAASMYGHAGDTQSSRSERRAAG